MKPCVPGIPSHSQSVVTGVISVLSELSETFKAKDNTAIMADGVSAHSGCIEPDISPQHARLSFGVVYKMFGFFPTGGGFS